MIGNYLNSEAFRIFSMVGVMFGLIMFVVMFVDSDYDTILSKIYHGIIGFLGGLLMIESIPLIVVVVTLLFKLVLP